MKRPSPGVFVLVLLLGGQAFADTTISGTQTRGRGTNGTLHCTSVRLPRGGNIVDVIGAQAGFWLQSNVAGVLRFESAAKAVGSFVPAGTWCAYPNLDRSQDEASVAVVVRTGGAPPPTVAPPTATPAPGAGLVGSWKRNDGPEIYTFTADGLASAQTGITGSWTSTGPNEFTVTWTHHPPSRPANFVDVVSISLDGRTISGSNNYGNLVSAARVQGASNAGDPDPGGGIVGSWKRTDGPEIFTYTADGRASTQTGNTGTWTRAGGSTFTVVWTHHPPGHAASFVDTLTLSADGRTLSGGNNYGNTVSTVRK